MEWALMVEALVAGEPPLDTSNSPLRNRGRVSGPAKDRLDILDFLGGTSQARENC